MGNNWSPSFKWELKYKKEVEGIARELNISLNKMVESILLAFIMDYRTYGVENVKISYIPIERKSKLKIEEVK